MTIRVHMFPLVCLPVLLSAACTIVVDESGSNAEVSLSALTVQDISGNTLPLAPPFNPDTRTYSVDVGPGVSSVLVSASTDDSAATVRFDGRSAFEALTQEVSLDGPTTTIPIRVEATGTSTEYTLTVNRARGSSNAQVASLEVDVGTLVPQFDSQTLSYDLRVPQSAAFVDVKTTLDDPNATFTLNGTPAVSGFFESVAIAEGASITIEVTAEDQVTTEIYSLNVVYPPPILLSNLMFNVGTLAPTFASNTFAYALEVPESTTQVRVTPTTDDADATIRVNGDSLASGSTSAPIDFTLDTENPVDVTLEKNHPDFGVFSTTYTVEVGYPPASDAKLAELSVSPGLLTPEFAPSVFNYTVQLDLSSDTPVSEIEVIPTPNDANASVDVNDSTVSSGAPPTVALSGPTTIAVTVTAEDGVTTQTYTIDVQDTGPGAWRYSGKLGVPLTNANLIGPTKLAVDSEGNTYVLDEPQRGIHVFDASGDFVKLLAPDGLDAPVDVAVDTFDNSLYVADAANDKVFKLDSDGSIVLEFDGTDSGDGQFETPRLLATGPLGHVYVLDNSHDYIQKFNENGEFQSRIGETDSAITNADGLAADSGVLYAGDWFNDTIKSYNTDNGEFLGAWTSIDYAPYGLAVDTSTGDVYAVGGDGKIYKYDSESAEEVATYASPGRDNGELSEADGIAIGPSGAIYVADTGNHRVQAFNSAGNHQASFGALADGQIAWARDFATDAASWVYVLDADRGVVQVFDATRAYVHAWPVDTTDTLTRIAVDPVSSQVYVGANSFASGSVYQHDAEGNLQATIDGAPSTFDSVDALAVDPDTGSIYVADANDISYYDTEGNHQGTFNDSGSPFGTPSDMMFDALGFLLVADSESNELLALEYDGTFDSLLYSADGFDGSFYIDANDYLYIPDKDIVSGYRLLCHDLVTDTRAWRLDLETAGTTISSGAAPIDFAPDGTVYIQAQDNSEGVLVYTR